MDLRESVGSAGRLLPEKEFTWETAWKKLDFVFELITDSWNGNKNLKLKIVDMCPAQGDKINA